MLLEATESIGAGSNATQNISTSATLITSNVQRNGLNISLAAASANPLYLLLWNGVGAAPTASATNFHVAVPAGGSWDGMIGPVVWRGAVVGFIPTAAGQVGVLEV